jgi:hypothetical protein
MNPQMQTQAHPERSTSSDITVSETNLLAGWGFDPHEIASLRLASSSGTRPAAATAQVSCVTWNFSACWWRRGELEL